MASSICARLVKPMTMASISLQAIAKRMDFSRSSALTNWPLPMIFMPMTPRPLACMALISATTGGTSCVGSSLFQTSSARPSMRLPCGFTRTRCTSVQSDAAAARNGQAVAGDAFGANPFLFLRLVEAVHDALPIVGPLIFDHAVNQQAVHVVGVEHFAVMINGGEDVGGLAGDFGLDEKFFARQSLDGVANPVERRVGLRAVKVSDALVVGVVDEVDEAVLAERGLLVAAAAAGAHAEAAQLDAGLAEGHLIHGGARGRGRVCRARPGQRPRREQCGAGEGGRLNELAAAVSGAI